MSYTTRCNAAERKVFRTLSSISTDKRRTEPALGTLDERLDILVCRLGGAGLPRMSKAAREAWLREFADEQSEGDE